jgi:thiosulfate dehydrogenase
MQLIKFRLLTSWIIIATGIIVALLWILPGNTRQYDKADASATVAWHPPDTSLIPRTTEGMLIRYGRDLVANTSHYLGPKGIVAQITNGMNCQNCHLDAGTRRWGNNYGGVFSTYPRFRERSGTVENIYKRINDCIDRSLNGNTLDTNSREMQAIAAYINWVGHNVPKGIKPGGAGIRDIAFLDRPADPLSGKKVYTQKCQRCHGADGSGLMSDDGTKYIYPPLWGNNSYNIGAGLHRISRFAGYVRDNMPFDAPYNSEPLTDAEAWDVAAFVNSQPRPKKDYSKDYPDAAGKPIDHPFGPFKDQFSEYQHKYGPYAAIKSAKEKKKGK